MRKREVAHDESPAIISDHPFEPRAEWYSLCKHCGLAMPAHADTTIDAREELLKTHKNTVRKVMDPARERALEIQRLHQGGRARLGYFSDDDPEE